MYQYDQLMHKSVKETFYACHGLFLEGHGFCDNSIFNVTDCMTIKLFSEKNTARCKYCHLQFKGSTAAVRHVPAIPPKTANRRIHLKG